MTMTGTARVAEDVQGKPQKFDLEERTARFGEAVIVFAKSSEKPSDIVTYQSAGAFWNQRWC